MIESFLASFDLFGVTYATGLLSAAVLAAVGVWLVARNHIFLGAAVSQASTLGVALALFLGASIPALGLLAEDPGPVVLAIVASVATAWGAGGSDTDARESAEALTGWIFLFSASLPVLLLAGSPHGLEEVQRLVFSTLLSASRADLVAFVGLALATAAVTVLHHRRLLLLVVDPPMAVSLGLRPRRWNLFLAIWLGLAVGFAIRAAGMLYTFGCLVLPALVARNLCREARPVLWLAPILALLAAAAGFFLGHVGDLPPAHTTVALLCAALPGAWAVRALRRG